MNHNNEYFDGLKYRNEIEVFSRLKGVNVPNLYNDKVNSKVAAALSEVYHEGPDLSLENPGDRFNSLINKSPENNDLIIKNENPTVDDVIKNNDYISWDAYFMNIAILASLRSKDTTKVGSVLVLNKKLIGMGYNGFPTGIDESQLPTSRSGDLQDTKYAYTIHSEQNCLLNTSVLDVTGSTMYVTLFPCCRCVAILMQRKVAEIVYLSDIHHDDPEYIASRKLLSLSNIKVRQYKDKILLNNLL